MQVLASFLFLFVLLTCHTNLKAQGKAVNMNYKEVSFVEAINSFRQQTGVKFLYNLEKVKDKRCKDLVLKNVPVNEAIETVLKHFGLTYSMVIVCVEVVGDVSSVSFTTTTPSTIE